MIKESDSRCECGMFWFLYAISPYGKGKLLRKEERMHAALKQLTQCWLKKFRSLTKGLRRGPGFSLLNIFTLCNRRVPGEGLTLPRG